MSQFLYYIPNVTKETVDLDALKLAYAFETVCFRRLCSSGPDGGTGVVISAVDAIDRCCYTPKSQTWEQIPGSVAWIGMWNGEPILPSDLARSRQLPGRSVLLGDGHEWEIPYARRCEDTPDGIQFPIPCLPRVYEITSGGEWTFGSFEKPYHVFWQAACRVWDEWIHGDGMDVQSTIQCSAIALAVNYRMSEVECGLLCLLTESTVPDILLEIVDYKTMIEWFGKKKLERELAQQTSSTGATDETPTTGQQLPNGL